MNNRVNDLLKSVTQNLGVVLICLLEFVYVCGYGIIWFILPIIAEEITSDVLMVGFLIAFPTVVSMLFAIPVGELTDRLGRKKPIVFGACVVISIGFFLRYVDSFYMFIAFGFFFGLAHQFFNTPIKAYLMDIAPKSKTGQYFGFYSASFSAGLMLGSVLGGFLLANNLSTGVVNISYVYVLIGLLILLITLALKETVKSEHGYVRMGDVLVGESLLTKGLFEYRKLGWKGLLILYLTFIIYLAPGITWTLEPLFYSRLKISSEFVGLILSMFTLPLILFTIPAGHLADKYGKPKMMILGLFVGGLNLVLFGLVADPFLFLVSAFMATTGSAFLWASTNGLLADLARAYSKGRIVGIWNVFEDLGYIVGPVLGGLVADIFSDIKAPFVLLGMILFLSMLPVVLVYSRDGK